MPTQITVSATTDYTGVALDDVGIIQFSNQTGTAEAIFSAAQFNGTAILDTVIMLRSTGGNLIRIKGGSVDAGSWSMASWVGAPGANDQIIFEGTANAVNSIHGSDASDTINGGSLNDFLSGGDGNDWLNGGAGADDLIGGEGHDVYVVDNAADVTIELINGGTDTVQASLSWTLQAQTERLTLTGSVNLNGTGNGLSNRLSGNSGNNVLDGGAGSDLMYGYDGDDTFHADVQGDIDFGGGGYDTVYSTAFAYTLSGGTERLYLQTGAINGGGNALANYLHGNANGNTIHGLDGPDTLKGVDGNDWLYGGAAPDILEGGAGADWLYGDGGADSLDGGAGADNLFGGGGADVMTGGAGHDFYEVDTASDTTVEAAGGGTDLVHSTVNRTLSANVENLTLIGPGNVNGTGNELGNSLTGNTGDNFLDGKLGIDSLTGGGGSDSFVFTTAPGAANLDYIEDFNTAADTIRLDDAIFTSLSAGNLAPAVFHIGQNAADASDRIIYRAEIGLLYYDPDGTGAAAAQLFAFLDPFLPLGAVDIIVF